MHRVLDAVAAAGQVVADQRVHARLVSGRAGAPHRLVEDDELQLRVEKRHRPRIGSAAGNEPRTTRRGCPHPSGGCEEDACAAVQRRRRHRRHRLVRCSRTRASDGPVRGGRRTPQPVRVVDATRRASSAARQRRPESFDRTAHSTTDPTSIWVIVNKTHPIAPSDFRPEIDIVRGYQVATAAADPLRPPPRRRRPAWPRLQDRQRVPLLRLPAAASTPRPPPPAATPTADLVSARAGYSEHQTGLAVDLVTPDDPACDFERLLRAYAGRPVAGADRLAVRLRRPLPAGDHRRHRLRARALAPAVRRPTARRGAAPHRDRDPGGVLRRARRRLPDLVTQTAGRAGSPVSFSTASVTTSQRCSRIDANMLVYA